MAGIARLISLSIAAALLLVAPSAAPAAIVGNGSFETVDFSGWQTDDTPGGQWVVYSAGSVIAVTIAAPPQATHAAATFQSSASRQILYQDVIVPPASFRTQLSLYAFYESKAPLSSPDTLQLSGTNEQYLIDVMRPGAPVDSVAPSDVLASVLRTKTGDALFLPATVKTLDLSRFAGQVVRLRFAVVAGTPGLTGGTDAV